MKNSPERELETEFRILFQGFRHFQLPEGPGREIRHKLPDVIIPGMHMGPRKTPWPRWGLVSLAGLVTLALTAVLVYQIPAVNNRLFWRIEILKGHIRGLLNPGDTLPVAQAYPEGPAAAAPVPMPDAAGSRAGAAEIDVLPATATSPPAATAIPTPDYKLINPPEAVTLTAPEWEKQGWNNCGPTTLAMGLRYWGWAGDQQDVVEVLKPSRLDKNVRWDELVYYVKTQAGWLDATFRVGGTPEMVRKFVANGYPVILEKGFVIEENNTGWTGHYNLVTGYDDKTQTWIAQDSWKGADQIVSYADMNKDWQAFNYLYILVYPVEDKEKILFMLGQDAVEAENREHALEIAQRETETDSDNAFAWLNYGSNLTYFERYEEAAAAFDRAREIGLPYRVLWYQFGPYRAYYNLARFQDVIDLADATLSKSDNLEESYFWRGWARYSTGDLDGAIADFRTALQHNPNYLDAKNALSFLGVSS